MKIGFLTSHRGQKQYEKDYRAIIAYFEKKGNEVIHSMDTTLEQLLAVNYAQREAILMKFYQKLEDCDVIFAECSVQSTQLGFGISYVRAKGKPVVMLYRKENAPDFYLQGEIYSSIENVLAYEYDSSELSRVLDEALAYVSEHLDKRFTIIFPSQLLLKVEEVSRKKKLPKSVYIRQLIEKDLATQE